MNGRTGCIGLVTGMGWQSGLHYERMLHQAAVAAGGPHRNAALVTISPVFADLLAHAEAGDWNAVGETLSDCLDRLCDAGADILLLTAVTAHLALPAMRPPRRPLLHIADAAAQGAQVRGVRRLGLLGTGFALRAPTFVDALRDRGLVPLLPKEPSIEPLHRFIVGRLEQTEPDQTLRAEADAILSPMIRALADAGADAILLACTELALVCEGARYPIPLLDAATLHAEAALRIAAAPSKEAAA